MDKKFQDVRITGTATFGADGYISFTPDMPVEDSVSKFRLAGTAQILSDGSFEFIKTKSSTIR